MRGTTWATIAAAALVSSTLTTSSDAAAARTLVIDASGSSYLDVRISRPVVFDLDRASFRGGSSYMGVVLDRIDPGASVSLLHVRFPRASAKAGTDATLGFDQSEKALPAGTYRLYALSDGAVRFSIPVAGLARDLRLTPARRVKPRYRAGDVPQQLDPATGSPYGGSVRLPGVAPGRGDIPIARFGALFAPGVVTAEGWDFCVAPANGDCLRPVGQDAYAVGVDTPGDAVDETTYLPRDDFRGGPYDVLAKCRAAQPARQCRVAVLDRYVSLAPSSGAVAL